MTILYEIILTIVNLHNDETATFNKDFDYTLEGLTDLELYNNYHKIADKVQMFTLFKNEINKYCEENHITVNNIDIDEFNINSKTERVDVYFEPGDGDDPNQISLEPNIRAYVYPKYDNLIAPTLKGVAYDNTTIIWSWEDDEQAHYLISEAIDIDDETNQDKIIAQIPIGINTYTETGLESDTSYTRRLISYNSEQTSRPSAPTTIQTATAPIDQSLDQYEVAKNYDYTSDDSERQFIDENLIAFHSGIGDYNDLKVYKQMDADFYQKFKAYIQVRGSRKQREKRYDSVGFNYKVCLESEETVEEQKGEVTFDIDVFPIETISIKDYMYSTQPVTVCARMMCDVLLKKKEDNDETVECPLKEPEWEQIEIDVPNEPNEWVEPELLYSPVSIVFVIDNTLSSQKGKYETPGMYAALNNQNGVPFVTSKCISLIGQIEAAKGDGVVDYSVIKFNSSPTILCKGVDADTAKAKLQALGYDGLTCTNWNTALDKAKECISQPHGAVFFFSDGGANTNATSIVHGNNSKTYEYKDGTQGGAKTILNSIQTAGSSLKEKADYVLAAVYKINEGISSGSPTQTFGSAYMKAIAQAAGTEYASWKDAGSLSDAVKQFLNKLTSTNGGYYVLPNGQHTSCKYHLPDGTPTDDPTHKEKNGWKFNGWKECDDTINISANWDIDQCKWAHVIIPPMNEDPWTITINDTITPVVYARNEQRAIVPSDSIIVDRNFDETSDIRQSAIKVDSRDIQTMILDAVKQTAAWNDGYNQLVEAWTDEEKKQGQYIIRGLFIKDTYKYADEDKVPDVNFNDDGLEDGYVGTINVYADINKLDTMQFGDDIYAVGTDKYVWLSGYTDAIIYDGERIESFDLNASHAETYDHQEEIIFSPVEDYKKYLWNRKNHSIKYTGDKDTIKHVIDIVVKDKDIYITGCNTLNKVGDWTLFVPQGTDISDTNKLIRGVTYPVIEILQDDIVAHNDEHYQSPILNYRFNYEDPDAYTSYYELLPDCDPFSPYQNIVFVHIYYARNIYIQDEEKLSGKSTVYIEAFGKDNIATRSSEYYKNSSKIKGQTYFRDDYIDDYIWFQAKPMYETRPYYDEKPNPGMDSFYGNVNGRYKDSNKSGKQDLRVVTPQFNLPTTIDTTKNKIYIMITEFYPDTALVSYKWDHPSDIKDSITQVNGDYVTFSSDSLTYKDITYNELVQTVTTATMELFDNKTTMKMFEIVKPLSNHTYDHYYIEVFSDNSDVLALNYPSEIVFDENNKAEFGVNFKGVVNATTKWSPRIHNGYYYLNQHEYFAYSEFDVEADFEEYNEENYKVKTGYLTIDVELIHKAGDPEHYDILKNTRSELMQNEKEFTWIDGKGLTILPTINGEFYKEYSAHTYVSPIIMFPHELTSADKLRVDYYFEDGSTELPMEVRSYDMQAGKWSEWAEFPNDQVPTTPLSCAYQVRFTLTASVTNSDKFIEDYLCCYLDWVDDGDTPNHTNCVTITDHLQAGPYESDGIFNSKIIDFGCESEITLDMFASNINKECELYIAAENYNKDKLLLENVHWTRVNESATITTRFFRYRVVIPYGEKVYWIHKKLMTKESTVLLPYITQIQMVGDYVPVDTYDMFQEIQSFEIITDGLSHRIFPSVYDIISGDVHSKGFEDHEIQFVRLNCTTGNMAITFNKGILDEYPSVNVLNSPVYCTADFEVENTVKYTPYIFANMDSVTQRDILTIKKGTPQQYCPITMEDASGIPYQEVFDVDPATMKKTEIFTIQTEDDTHYIKLARNDFDIKTISVTLNDEEFDGFKIVNNLIIFNINPNIGDIIKVEYNILYSFFTEIDYEKNTTKMTIYSDFDGEQAKKDEIKNLKPIVETGTYKVCDLSQIYSNGEKISFNSNSITNDSLWKYDAGIPGIYYSTNSDKFSAVINTLVPLKAYNIDIIAYSTSADDDVIGFVVCYVKDTTGKPHTLSYLVSLGGILFDDCNTALVMDCGSNTEHIIATKKVDCSEFKSWSEMINGFKFHIVKNQTTIQCKISNWNDPETWNDESQIIFDLSSNESTRMFEKTVCYGFCTQSQQDTFFVSPVFEGKVDHTITVEEQIKNLKHKYKTYFETNTKNNKFIAENLSLNPVYRTDYKGFIYLTDEHNEPYKINIYRNPKYIKAGGYDKIDIAIECLDYEGNPVISKDIDIDCNYGILNFDNTDAKHLTDINGVIHVLYESAVEPCTDIFTARTVTSDGTIVQSSVDIINE